MKPKLEILPPTQLKLWPQLSAIPSQFILYGGTAIALQLGHRQSVDFDFFSSAPLDSRKLLEIAPFLAKGKIVQPEINTLNCYLEIDNNTVQLQFLAGIDQRQGRVEPPLQCDDNGIYIASLRDLFATKLNTIQARAELKDYLDIYALLQHGLKLEDGLACAKAVYGPSFDPGTSLRALCSYRDGDLPELTKKHRNYLSKTALSINEIPFIKAISPQL